ncbi:MAG: outer membrane protein assembly factor BamE [Gammaproteobacteria bacterium]
MPFRVFFRRLPRNLFAAAIFCLCAGCAYKSEIRQGNDLLPGNIDALRPGMSKTEVRELLGENRLPAVFADENAWFYYYRRRAPGFVLREETWSVRLVFTGDSLAEIIPSPPNP